MFFHNRRYFIFALWVSLGTIGVLAQQPVLVKVGGYDFLPYFSMEGGKPRGISADLVDLLNHFQSQYHFDLKEIPSKRRYILLEEGYVDLLLFEDKNWEWENKQVLFSQPLLKDSESFLTLQEGEKSQDFFKNPGLKSLVAVKGYHYAIAGFNADETWLKNNFKISLVSDQYKLLEALTYKRGELALITTSFFKNWSNQNPVTARTYILSQEKDQEYTLCGIISPRSPLTPEAFRTLLVEFYKSGHWTQFLAERGLEDQNLLTP